MILRQFLPERTSEDILAGRIRLSLDGVEYILPVRTIRQNRAWKELMAVELEKVLGGFGSLSSAGDILNRVSAATDAQIELVRAYDLDGKLPDLEDVTEPELLRATFAILAAAFPSLAMALDQLLDQPELLGLVLTEIRGTTASSEPTNSSPTPMAGPRRRSKAS